MLSKTIEKNNHLTESKTMKAKVDAFLKAVNLDWIFKNYPNNSIILRVDNFGYKIIFSIKDTEIKNLFCQIISGIIYVRNIAVDNKYNNIELSSSKSVNIETLLNSWVEYVSKGIYQHAVSYLLELTGLPFNPSIAYIAACPYLVYSYQLHGESFISVREFNQKISSFYNEVNKIINPLYFSNQNKQEYISKPLEGDRNKLESTEKNIENDKIKKIIKVFQSYSFFFSMLNDVINGQKPIENAIDLIEGLYSQYCAFPSLGNMKLVAEKLDYNKKGKLNEDVSFLEQLHASTVDSIKQAGLICYLFYKYLRGGHYLKIVLPMNKEQRHTFNGLTSPLGKQRPLFLNGEHFWVQSKCDAKVDSETTDEELTDTEPEEERASKCQRFTI